MLYNNGQIRNVRSVTFAVESNRLSCHCCALIHPAIQRTTEFVGNAVWCGPGGAFVNCQCSPCSGSFQFDLDIRLCLVRLIWAHLFW